MKWYEKYFISGARAWFNYFERLEGKNKKSRIKLHIAGVIGTIAAGLVWSFAIFCIWAFLILISRMDLTIVLGGGLAISLLWSFVSFKIYKRKKDFFTREKKTIDDLVEAAALVDQANAWNNYNKDNPVVFRTGTDKTVQ